MWKRIILLITFAACWLNITASMVQGQTEAFPDGGIFDLAVSYVDSDRSSMAIRWYPPDNYNDFMVVVSNLSNGKVRKHTISGENHVELNQLDPDAEYSVKVVARDPDDKIVGRSPVEKLNRKQLPTTEQFRYETSPAQAPSLDATLLSLDSNNFPFIFTTVAVDTNTQPVGGITKSDFTVFEDGRTQTDFFEVIPPQQGGNVRTLDFVFVIDNSGSMIEEQQQVKDNVKAFVDSLEARKIDVRLGLVRFGQSAIGGQPIIMNNGILTGDFNFFKSLLKQLTAQGGVEPGIEAIFQAANTFSFRPGSQRHFLLITDEDSDGGNLAQTISTCQNNNIIVHAAVDCNLGSSDSHYCNANSIRGATGGLLFDVIGPYRDILDVIQSEIGNTYIVRYRTDNPVLDGQQREVRILINAFGQTDEVIGFYTPGAAPVIQRTQATINLSNSAQIGGVPLTIAAAITDGVAPFVQGALVFFRTTGTLNYTSIPMNLVGNNIYEAVIPGTAVQTPGIDYYITATDGQVTSSDPPVDPDTFPHQIAVLPNQPPNINHTPVTSGNVGNDILISAAITDNTNFLASQELHYREIGTLIFQTVSMNALGGNQFEATIPGSVVGNAGVEYFIRAVDNFGLATIHGVHTVTIGGCVPASFSDNFDDGNANGWQPNDPSKWAVQQVDGDFAYCLVNSNPNGNEYSLLPSIWQDFVLELEAKSTGVSNKGYFVVFGVQDFTNSPDDSYVLRVLDSGVDLFQSVGGNGVIIASASGDFVSDNNFHHIKVERSFPNIRVSIDGQFLFEVTDATFAQGHIGFGVRKNTGCFDNVSISTECESDYAITIPAGLKVPAGNSLAVPIIVTAEKAIGLAQFTIDYDGGVLRFDSATIGPDAPGFTVAEVSTNPPFPPTTPGTDKNLIAQISGAGTNSFVGQDKTVLFLNFTAVGNSGDTSPLASDRNCSRTFLTTTDLQDICGNQISFSDGDAMIIAALTIEGNVSYYSNAGPVENTVLTLRGASQSTQTTNANGHYLFSSVSPGNYTLTPSKNSDHRNAIRGSDALLIMRELAFLENLTPDQRIAADVTQNGNLSPADVVAILRFLAFFTSNVAQTGEWRFSPATASLSLPPNATQDFTAFLLGDPTGDWSTTSASLAESAPGDAIIRIGEATMVSEAILNAPVFFDSVAEPMRTLTFSIEYDATSVAFIGLTTAPPLRDYATAINDLETGKIHFATVGLSPVTKAQKVLDLRFRIKSLKKSFLKESHTHLRFIRAEVNDQAATWIDGATDIAGTVNTTEVPQEFALLQNYPNPFNPETTIEFQVARRANVAIAVYNLIGQRVTTLFNQEKEAGYYQIKWNGKDSFGRPVTSGVYVYRIMAGDFVASRKLVVLR